MRYILLAITAALLAASPVAAETLTLQADADTYIRYNSNEGNNCGNNDHMFCDNGTTTSATQ